MPTIEEIDKSFEEIDENFPDEYGDGGDETTEEEAEEIAGEGEPETGTEENAKGTDGEPEKPDEISEEIKALLVEKAVLERKLKDADEVVKRELLESLDDLLAKSKNKTVEEYNKSLSEMSIEEKAAAYDRMTGQSSAEDAFKAKEQADLALIYAVYPEAKESVKAFTDLDDPQRFMNLVDNGIPPADAYVVVQKAKIDQAKAEAAKRFVKNAGKNHLSASVGKRSASAENEIPGDVMESMKDIYPNLSEKEIVALYRRTNK